MSPHIAMAVVLGLIVCSALFSGSETALTSANAIRLRQRAQDGDRRAALALKLQAMRGTAIGSILIGNNIVNITASALTSVALVEMMGPSGVAYATALLTVVIVLFAEVAPKSFAVKHAERVLLAVAPILYGFILLLTPVNWLMQSFMRLLGLNADGEEKQTEEDLRGAIELHGEHVDDGKEEAQMMQGVLDLDRYTAEHAMTHRMSAETTTMEALRQDAKAVLSTMIASRHSTWPVLDARGLFAQGAVTVRSLSAVVLEGLPVEDALIETVYVTRDTALREALAVLKSRDHTFAVVTDALGAFEGVLTLEDVIEEVIGDVSSGDLPEGIARDGQGYLIEGDTSPRYVARGLGLELESDAVTMADLVHRTVPDEEIRAGAQVVIQGHAFLLVDVDERLAIRRIGYLPPANDEAERPDAGLADTVAA